MADVDGLSDAALAASKLAKTTHQDEHHQAAKAAHEAAYKAADGANRPSLAQHHLQKAASHDQHADPTTPLGKGAIAHRASAKAKASGKAEDHDVAAQAHAEAAQAHHDDGNARQAAVHGSLHQQHGEAARQIRQPPRPMGPGGY
jgi:hypothetical protein